MTAFRKARRGPVSKFHGGRGAPSLLPRCKSSFRKEKTPRRCFENTHQPHIPVFGCSPSIRPEVGGEKFRPRKASADPDGVLHFSRRERGREPLRRGRQRPSGCVSCVSRTRAFAFATCQNILRDGNTWLVFTPAAECFVQTAKTLSVYGLAVRYPPTARSEVVLQFGMLCSSP